MCIQDIQIWIQGILNHMKSKSSQIIYNILQTNESASKQNVRVCSSIHVDKYLCNINIYLCIYAKDVRYSNFVVNIISFPMNGNFKHWGNESNVHADLKDLHYERNEDKLANRRIRIVTFQMCTAYCLRNRATEAIERTTTSIRHRQPLNISYFIGTNPRFSITQNNIRIISRKHSTISQSIFKS